MEIFPEGPIKNCTAYHTAHHDMQRFRDNDDFLILQWEGRVEVKFITCIFPVQWRNHKLPRHKKAYQKGRYTYISFCKVEDTLYIACNIISAGIAILRPCRHRPSRCSFAARR